MTSNPADPLPTEAQRRALCEMMAYAFIEMRLLGWSNKSARTADLADAFHNVPREMYGLGRWNIGLSRMELEAYQRKYADDAERRPYNYVEMFDRAFGTSG